MKIETKFDVGEEVHYMSDNKICSDRIYSVSTHSIEMNRAIRTSVYYSVNNYKYDEHKLFKTKEELLNSL